MRVLKSSLIVLLTVGALISFVSGAASAADELGKAGEAMTAAMAEMGLSKGDRNLLVLTNAGYGSIGNKSTEAFLDTARELTGCSPGNRSLLAVHTSLAEPLWGGLYRKDTGKLVFFKWTGAGFEQQVIDASPSNILTPDGWKEASSGLIGNRAFSVVSISLTWAADPPWPLLHSATFHDHFCPGVNSGYIAGKYLMEKMALGSGDRYVFLTGGLGKCAADALQVMFNTTPGKSGGYIMDVDNETLAKYTSNGTNPLIIAMRINNKSDVCDGTVLGFDWNKAYVDTGVKAEEMRPKGGPANPMFWIARVKMSKELARMPDNQLFSYMVELKSFSGKAELAAKVTGGDPYAVVWDW